jgi:DNA polymerase V
MLHIHPADTSSVLTCPLSNVTVQAGQPSPALDHAEEPLDLNRLLIRHPKATFYVYVSGDSMNGAGLLPGDLLVVDRARASKRGDIVVAVVDGRFTVKRLDLGAGGVVILWAENPAYGPIVAEPGRLVEIWGVVTACVHRFVA